MDSDSSILKEQKRPEEQPVVLVVDDDETHQKLLQLLADRLAVSIYPASSCAKAIEALKLVAFDLILMDYRMPEVDGCDCVERIREMKELRKHVPIVAVTGDVMPGTRTKCLNAGMDDFLGKPFTIEELHEKLSYWLAKKTV